MLTGLPHKQCRTQRRQQHSEHPSPLHILAIADYTLPIFVVLPLMQSSPDSPLPYLACSFSKGSSTQIRSAGDPVLNFHAYAGFRSNEQSLTALATLGKWRVGPQAAHSRYVIFSNAASNTLSCRTKVSTLLQKMNNRSNFSAFRIFSLRQPSTS
ncbi:uncharacterized protein SCHCODRAFT_02606639 [Schizophyllum commune H4-8]|uniref:uncharacterized protein n=1 Tax=Schizophyllum commune (strain H4-8 / FGSC 9210) TaxID=578458 RepID=UPI0021609ED4|nr:uncharacterized protein SCHCODRAFT_02606639 [Schizophyllum commune H4-8]KAI5899974.1 hypothetical protein SCHCODRAFT_02606639 [Schizophyllum commune H4-8]